MLAVCCDRGSPGSTTTALALAATTGDLTVMVEADPYGGDVATRCRPRGGGVLSPTPTVLTAAVAARTDSSAHLISRYSQVLIGQLCVLPGHLSAEQADTLADWGPLAHALRISTVPVVVDVGRIHSRSPSLPIAAAAEVVLAVTRAHLPGFVHLRDRLDRLVPALGAVRGAPPRVVPVVIAPQRQAPRHAAELAAVLADSTAGPMVDHVSWLAWDPNAVSRLGAGEALPGLARTPLFRSARTLHAEVHNMLGRFVPGHPATEAAR